MDITVEFDDFLSQLWVGFKIFNSHETFDVVEHVSQVATDLVCRDDDLVVIRRRLDSVDDTEKGIAKNGSHLDDGLSVFSTVTSSYLMTFFYALAKGRTNEPLAAHLGHRQL